MGRCRRYRRWPGCRPFAGSRRLGGWIVAVGLGLASFAPAAATTAWEEAEAHYRAKRWAEAERAFEALVDRDEGDGEAWLRLAIARKHRGDLAGAVLAYERAAALGVRSFVMLGDAAAAYARLGDHDRAFEWLDRLAREAGPTPDFLMEHEGLEPLRNDPRFDLLLERQVRAQHLCTSTNHRALDFWIGTWTVQDQRGQVVGTNRIERVLGSCALIENWRSWTGREGKSLNYFDASRGVWRQVWVGDWGGALEQEGRAIEGGGVEFLVEVPSAEGDTELNRMRLRPLDEDRVRQTIESSADGGTSWELTTDFHYVRAR